MSGRKPALPCRQSLTAAEFVGVCYAVSSACARVITPGCGQWSVRVFDYCNPKTAERPGRLSQGHQKFLRCPLLQDSSSLWVVVFGGRLLLSPAWLLEVVVRSCDVTVKLVKALIWGKDRCLSTGAQSLYCSWQKKWSCVWQPDVCTLDRFLWSLSQWLLKWIPASLI